MSESTEAINDRKRPTKIPDIRITICKKAMITVSMEIKAELKVLCKDMENLKVTLQIKKNPTKQLYITELKSTRIQ